MDKLCGEPHCEGGGADFAFLLVTFVAGGVVGGLSIDLGCACLSACRLFLQRFVAKGLVELALWMMRGGNFGQNIVAGAGAGVGAPHLLLLDDDFNFQLSHVAFVSDHQASPTSKHRCGALQHLAQQLTSIVARGPGMNGNLNLWTVDTIQSYAR